MESLIETPVTPQVGQPGANRATGLFRELVHHCQLDPASPDTEASAANLAAYLASSRGVCVGVIYSNQLTSVLTVITVLDGFGVAARYRNLHQRNGRLIFLEIDQDEPENEFEGATVKARYVRRAVAA
jgi:hypothetical protein